MSEWARCTLGELGIVIGGGTPAREAASYWGSAIPWLTPGELTGKAGKYVHETQDCISELGLAKSGAKLLPTESLLVTSRATIGSCALAGIPMTTNQGFQNLIPNCRVDSTFLLHLTRSLNREMMRRSSGTTFLEISGKELEQITIKLPPLEEQRRISAILDAADETIQTAEEAITKRRRIRTALAADLLDTELRQDESTMRRLADIADSMVDGPFGSAIKTEHYVPDAGVRVVRLANLGDGHYVDIDAAFIDEEHAGALGRHDVRAGDVLIASLGDDNHRPGRACLYPTEFAPGIVKADCFRIRPSSTVDSHFLMELLNSQRSVMQMRRLTQGVTRDRINLRHLRRVVLCLPSLNIQRRIAEILEEADCAIRRNQAHLAKLRGIRSGLASDLLTELTSTVAA